jgi:hypothetical protein
LFVSELEHHQLSGTELENMRDQIASAMVHLHEQFERIETFLLFAKLHDRGQQAQQKPAPTGTAKAGLERRFSVQTMRASRRIGTETTLPFGRVSCGPQRPEWIRYI